MSPLPRLARVKAAEGHRLRLSWADGGASIVDMTGVINGFEPFAPLKDVALFAQAKVTGHGSGIEWPGGLDFSAASLAHLAAEQTPMSGRDLERWQRVMGLSLRETADIFGVTVGTVKNYRKLDKLPIALQIACRTMRSNPETFWALYRPRVRGRPRAGRSRALAAR